MPRQHAVFCDLDPADRGHGLYCISRPIARQAPGLTEQGKPVDVTVDLAVVWSKLDTPRMVRVITEPPSIEHRAVTILTSGAARQLAAALLVAAGQAEETDRDVTRPRVQR